MEKKTSVYQPAEKTGGVTTTTRIRTEDPDLVGIASHFSRRAVERAKEIALERGVPYENVLDEWRQAIP